jgi:hypothetical protein
MWSRNELCGIIITNFKILLIYSVVKAGWWADTAKHDQVEDQITIIMIPTHNCT